MEKQSISIALLNEDRSMMMKSKKSGGYSPKYGEGLPSLGGPLMKVWKIVKKMLPFFGTLPFLRMSSGLIRTRASSGNAVKDVKSLKAWSARLLRSARKRIRGRRVGGAPLFQ